MLALATSTRLQYRRQWRLTNGGTKGTEREGMGARIAGDGALLSSVWYKRASSACCLPTGTYQVHVGGIGRRKIENSEQLGWGHTDRGGVRYRGIGMPQVAPGTARVPQDAGYVADVPDQDRLGPKL